MNLDQIEFRGTLEEIELLKKLISPDLGYSIHFSTKGLEEAIKNHFPYFIVKLERDENRNRKYISIFPRAPVAFSFIDVPKEANEITVFADEKCLRFSYEGVNYQLYLDNIE